MEKEKQKQMEPNQQRSKNYKKKTNEIEQKDNRRMEMSTRVQAPQQQWEIAFD